MRRWVGLAALALWAALVFPVAGEAQPAGQEWVPGDVFKDCVECPEMVVLPSGTFRMGSEEESRWPSARPVRDVEVARFALGRYEVTKAQYAVFAAATGRAVDDGCSAIEVGQPWELVPWEWDVDVSRRSPGFDQDKDHPVVCASWADATAMTAWLSGVTGHVYRLPSEAELEYAARAEPGPRYWGDAWDCKAGNSRDLSWRQHPDVSFTNCHDGVVSTRAVGSYEPNAFGLFDVLGNVWEWGADCWHENYAGAPVDGSAWLTGGDCRVRVMRGGSWIDPVMNMDLHPARRNGHSVGDRFQVTGFRVARSLP